MPPIYQNIKKATSTKKGKIIFFSILFAFAALATTTLLYWQINKKRIIRQGLESAIHEKSNGLYRVTYNKLQLDEVNGSLKVTNIHLEYDSLKLVTLLQQGDAPSFLFKVDIPELTVYGVKTPQVLIGREINGTKLNIHKPNIEIIYTLAGKDSTRYTPAKEVYKQLLGELNQIVIDTLSITGAIIHTRNLTTPKHNIGLYNASVELLNVKIDSTANADSTRMLFAKNVNLQCDSLFWNSDDGLYKIGGDTLAMNSATNTVTLNRFYIKPFLAEDAFVHNVPTQVDRLDVSIKHIAINQIDFLKLFEENIVADNITIASASFKIYRDLSIPRDKKSRIGGYPHQAIAKIPIPLEVKQINISDTYIEYGERSDKTGKTGRIRFHDTKAVLKNVTNKKNKTPGIMTADIDTRFLDKTSFHTRWTFHLGHPNGRFGINGTLNSINAKDLNTILEPMGPARMEDGRIKRLDFTLAGNDYNMNGNIKFVYDDMKVAILEKDEDSKELNKKGVTSLIANFVMKNSNPSGNKETPRTVSVKNERDPNRSIFHFSWNTLLTGVKETMGINRKK